MTVHDRGAWYRAACLVAVSGLLPLSAFSAAASWSPEKNVEIVIASGPGGGNDRVGRTVQKMLQDLKLVNVTTSVVNKPGGGGFIGWTYLNQQAGDAHYISTSTPNLLTTHISGRSQFTYSEITPIAQLYGESGVFVVKSDSKIQSAKDLLERIKNDPAGFSTTVGTGAGNHNHIALGALAQAVGGDPRKLKVVIFKSSSEATTAVMGGHVDVAIVAASSRRKQVEAGTMKALAVASSQRLPGPYAAVPTWKELGVDVVSAFWVGVIGPRGLSRAQTDFWERTFASLVRSDDWKSYLERYSLEDTYMDGQASAKFLDAQYREYKSILSSLGLAKTPKQ
ncbi:MAG: tripartite tricarboxylate transporter substrate binding protein [Burkholderiales bacterium]|nr:tripartite tricarboxylate transporter substrate binding protein [Burkholderiales bacterium]